MNPIPEQTLTCCVCHIQIRPTRRDPWTVPNGGPFCLACLSQKEYETANTQRLGDPDGLPAFSVEFEICACDLPDSTLLQRAWALLPYSFLRTEDSSVGDEYKSPIYQSAAAFKSVLPLLQRLGNLVDDCCGTHIHISCPRKQWVRQHAQAIFEPLLHHWATHQNETLAFWGRCHAPCKGDVAVSTRYDTVEFRLPRFRSAAQYLAVVCYCRHAVMILNGWLANVESSAAFARCTPDIGAELLSLYQQACSSALSNPTWLVHSTSLFVCA